MSDQLGSEGSVTSARKDQHLDAVLGWSVASTVTTGFERWRLRHRALPGVDLGEVDLSVRAWGHDLSAPLLVSCMTGGSELGRAINANLACAAEQVGVAVGLGSVRAAVEDPDLLTSFDVRHLAPSVPLLANTGVVDIDVTRVADVVHRLEADVLVVHLNALQEALQPEGNAAFRGATDTVARLVDACHVPVVVKEVGFGLDPADVESVLAAGCDGVDVAGAGGTNWALVEAARAPDVAALASAFAGWGTPTAEALVAAVAVRDHIAPDAVVVASGGIRTGVDAAKALALGADLVGVGAGWLRPATESADAAGQAIETVVEQLRLVAFACGAADVADLDRSRLSDLSGS